ncbi:MAG: sugar phosphate nucleotidyltransferase [Sulfolobaceae archaeon]
MKVRKAVITAAGRGSRMKYITSIIPKALLPVFYKENGQIIMRPIIDLILDSLESVGVEKFGIVVGIHGRLLLEYLFERQNKVFLFQEKPKGFGDAVLRAEDFTGNSPFFVHADDGVLTGAYKEAKDFFEEVSPDALLLLRKVENPRRYGIVEVNEVGYYANFKLFKIKDAEEKPTNPKSNIAISAVYIFSPKIFSALKEVKVDEDKELELTYGIQRLIENGGEVYGLLLENVKWLNVGDPLSYLETLNFTFNS